MRCCSDGDSTVPGQIALQRILRPTKSAAIALVRPITAALLTPYANRFGAPLMLDATEDMLMIEPPPRASMPGSSAWIMRYIEVTLSCQAKSQSSLLHSRMLPACTKPAQLKITSNALSALACCAASAWIAAVSVTSSRRVSIEGACARSVCSASALMSVASTRAPSRANASALARPMPCPAAVTSVRLSCKRMRNPLLPGPMTMRGVVRDVQIARHHQHGEYELEIQGLLEHGKQLRDQRTTADAHDQQRRAALDQLSQAVDRERKNRRPHHRVGKAERSDKCDRQIAARHVCAQRERDAEQCRPGEIACLRNETRDRDETGDIADQHAAERERSEELRLIEWNIETAPVRADRIAGHHLGTDVDENRERAEPGVRQTE